MAAKKHKPIPKAEGRGGIPGPDCQKSPSRTTCAYGWDTYREICRRACARPQGRVRGSAANFVPRGKHSDRVLWTMQRGVLGCAAEALPAAETAEAEQGPPSKFSSGLRPAQKIWVTATRGRAPVFAREQRGRIRRTKQGAARGPRSVARAPRRPPQKQGTATKEFLSRACVQKWVPPKACRFRHAAAGEGSI